MKTILLKVLYGVFYILIGLNIGNLWLITDDYINLDLTRDKKNVYFGFIFTQIFMLLFLAQRNKILVNIFVLFNIIFTPIVMFKYEILVSTSENKFFNTMNGFYVVIWFILVCGMGIYWIFKCMVGEYCNCLRKTNRIINNTSPIFDNLSFQYQTNSHV
jgi:hypothetical protein